jgi:orotate phosphoribosyltransferase
MPAISRDFIAFAVACDAIKFGEFTTKAGRVSPYFFNTGVFNDGERLRKLAQFYAKAIVGSGVPFDMLFGAAYKGIPLVSGTAIALADLGQNVPYCFNRKEAKDHGEGGSTVGAPLAGKVLIVDDVISAGTSVRESVAIIRSAGAQAGGVVICLDRMERGSGLLSATQEVVTELGIPVVPIADLDDLIDFVRTQQNLAQYLLPISRYRDLYGVSSDDP